MNKTLMKKNLLWTICILWMLSISYFSSMSSTESNKKSQKLIASAVEVTITISDNIKITDYHFTSEEYNQIAVKLNYPFRKCLHASVFLILAILTINAFKEVKVDTWKKYMYTFLFCFIWAIFDELHQLGIEGRKGQFLDVVIDTIGCLIGIGIYIIFQNRELKKLKLS